MKKFKFSIDGTAYNVDVKTVEGNQVEIEVNGTPYSVELDQEVKTSKTPILIRKEVQTKPNENRITQKAAPVSPYSKPSANAIKSPLPGSITRIVTTVGATVKPGDVLLIMESMKMENNILAEKNGIIKSIAVAPGQAVLQDDVLMEME